MSVSFYDLTIGSYVQILPGLVGVLQKGADHFSANGIDPAEIVETRLIADMANLHFQVTSVTHHSLGAIRALESGEDHPSLRKPDYATKVGPDRAALALLQSPSAAAAVVLARPRRPS